MSILACEVPVTSRENAEKISQRRYRYIGYAMMTASSAAATVLYIALFRLIFL